MLATIILYSTIALALALGCKALTVIEDAKASQLEPRDVDGVL